VAGSKSKRSIEPKNHIMKNPLKLFTGAELRPMLQPSAEKVFHLALNAKLQGKGSPLPFRMEGVRGVGKTSQGLGRISSLLESRGWKVEQSPFPTKADISEKACLAWLGKLCLENSNTVIVWDEAENLPWAALKKIISSNPAPVPFTFHNGEEKIQAVYNPRLFIWLLASNFSIDGNERGAGESRTIQVPFLPYNPEDKETLWSSMAKDRDIAFAAETIKMGARNSLPIGRDMEKEIDTLHSLQIEVPTLNYENPEHLREALIYCGYYPQGLTQDHITVLRYLLQAPLKVNGESYGCTLRDVRAHAMEGRDETEVIDSLSAAKLILTTPGGRRAVSQVGSDYLEALEAWEAENAEALERKALSVEKWKATVSPVKSPKSKTKGKGKGK
jgi:hypothetical protein